MTNKSSNMLRTVVGQWLLVALLGLVDELRDRIHQRLNGGQPGWRSFDEAAVVEAASELAAHRLLPSGADQPRITAMTAEMRSKMHANYLLGPIAMVEVMRAALGQRDVDSKNMGNNSIFTAYDGIVGYSYLKLRMDEASLAQLIGDAEAISFGRRWKPPLAECSHSWLNAWRVGNPKQIVDLPLSELISAVDLPVNWRSLKGR
jgi:hypothetical protein